MEKPWPGPPALTDKLSIAACVSHDEETEALGDGGSEGQRHGEMETLGYRDTEETDRGTGRPRQWGIEEQRHGGMMR